MKNGLFAFLIPHLTLLLALSLVFSFHTGAAGGVPCICLPSVSGAETPRETAVFGKQELESEQQIAGFVKKEVHSDTLFPGLPATDSTRGQDVPVVVIPCESAKIACTGIIYTFPSGTSGTTPNPVGGYPNYGCLGFRPGPIWYYMQVGIAGDIILTISQVNLAGSPLDIDFVCWGPFTSLSDGCATGLTLGNIVDCSFSPVATETCHILNAQAGKFYILLMTNFIGTPGWITFSQTGGIGVTNCNPVIHCTMIAMTHNASACNPSTNTFSVSGNVEFTNPSPTGTLTVTDITAVPPVSQTFSTPPFTSPKAYNLTNIPCDGAIHSLTAVFSDSTNCTLTQQFTSPEAICPQAHISGGGTICNNGIQQATVSVAFPSGSPPYTFIYAIDGVSQAPIIYNNTTPYQIFTGTPGVYTLVSVSNQGCPAGTVSGSASVMVNPLPTAGISGTTTVCINSPAPLITFSGGSATPPYTFTYNINGGGIQTISTTSGNSVTIAVPTTSQGSFTYNLVSVQDASTTACSQLQTGSAAVTVAPVPIPAITGTDTVCLNSVKVYSTEAAMTGYLWTVPAGGSIIGGGSTNSISVSWLTTGTKSISVNYTNAFGCSAAVATSYIVKVFPLPVTTITEGPGPACESLPHIYQVPADPTCTFSWTINPTSYGTILAGQGTNVVNINWLVSGNAMVGVTGTTTTSCVTSSTLQVQIKPSPKPVFTPCFDLTTTPGAMKIILRGGSPSLPAQGVYSGAHVTLNTLTGNYEFDPFGAPAGSYPVVYNYINTFGCQAVTAAVDITVQNKNFSCGGNLTDVRDGKIYKTAFLAGHCWMTQNLNYGGALLNSPLPPQSENCQPEKYCAPGDASGAIYGGLYQWDELMDYTVTTGAKGLCPPEWHLPSDVDWQQLIDNLIAGIPAPDANGFVAPWMTDSFLANGFHALLGGFNYMDHTWAFNTGTNTATMYWTSTENGNDRAVARGINFYNHSISKYVSSRANAFSARCVKD